MPLRNEPLKLHKILGLVCGFIGVAIIFGIDAIRHFDLHNLGQLCIIGATLSYGIAFILGKKYAQGINAYISCSAMLICSAVMIFFITILWQTDLPQQARSWNVWVALLYMSLVGTGFAYVLYYYLLARVDTVNVSLVTFIAPPVTIILGWLFLQEVLRLNDYMGMLLILSGLILIDKRMNIIDVKMRRLI